MADAQQNILINIDLETGQVDSKLSELDSKIGDIGKNVKTQSFKSVRSEIQAAREEAIRLAIAIEDSEAAGENIDKLSARYNEVTQKAAQLTDAVGKVNDSIGNANPDNRLQGLVSIAQGAITAVQGVAGAFTLLGVDAETANVAIARLQGLIALTDSISSIDKITDGWRDLTAVINLSSVATKVNTVATAGAVAIQRALGVAFLQSAAATRVFTAALVATGIGALVVILGTAVAALMDWNRSAKAAESATISLKDEIEGLTEAYDDQIAASKRAGDEIIAELKARGASEKQIRDTQLAQRQSDLAAANKRVEELDRLHTEALKNNQFSQVYDRETYQKALQARTDAQSQVRIQEANNRAAELAETKKLEADKLADQRRAADERKNDIRDLNQFTEQERIADRKRFQTSLQFEIDEINRKYQRFIQLAKAYGKSTVELEKLRQNDIAAATSKEIARAEEFGVTASLELVAKKLEILGKDINNEVSKALGATKDAEQVRKAIESVVKKRNDDIKSLFSLGAQLRFQQALQERNLRLEAIKTLTFSTDDAENKARRAAVEKVIQDDFELQTRTIRDEINNAEASLRKGIEITLLEVNVADAERRVEQVKEILDKLQQPFRVLQEQTIRDFDKFSNDFRGKVRRALTSIDIEQELSLRDQRNRQIEGIEKQTQQRLQAITDEAVAKRSESVIKSTTEELRLRNELRKNLFNGQSNFVIDSVALEKKLNEQIANIKKQSQAEVQKINEQQTFDELKAKADRDNQIIKAEQDLAAKIAASRFTLGTFTPGESSFIRDFFQSDRFEKQFDTLLTTTREYYDRLREQEQSDAALKIKNANFNAQEIEKIQKESAARLVEIERQYQGDIQSINDATLYSKLELYDQIALGLGNLGALFDRNTAAAKVAGLAEIAINTGTGFIKGLDIAQKTAAGFGPGAAYAFPIFYASQVAAVLAAASRAKQILAPVKGGSGGAGGSLSSPTPPTPTALNTTLFNLPPEAQNVRVVNQASQVVRAYITNDDLRSAQDRQAFLNKLSSF